MLFSSMLAGCAGGLRVPPPVVDGTQAAAAQDQIRTVPAPVSTPKAQVKPSAISTRAVEQTPTIAAEPLAQPQQTPAQVAKLETPPATSAQISEPVLELLNQADQQAIGGDQTGAMATLERALRIAPREPEIYYQMARLRLDMDQPKDAESLALKAVDLAADSFVRRDSWNLVALARDRAGDKAGAIAAREKARGS